MDSLGVTVIGTFVVRQPNATLFPKKSVPLEEIGKTSGSTGVYNIRGDVIAPTSDSKHMSGVYFVKPNGRSAAKMKIWY